MKSHKATHDVLRLVDSKTRCLQRFLELTKRFLSTAENGDFSGLNAFEIGREAIVKALGMYDRKVNENVIRIPLADRNPTLSHAVQARLNEQGRLLKEIIKIDQHVMVCIEREKNRVQQELINSQKRHELAGRFKSSWMPESGEGLDQKL